MKLLTTLICLLLIGSVSHAESEPDQEVDLATADLGELDRQLNNPLTSIWSLTFQNNTAVKQGDAIDGSEISNTLFFQPFMPFAAGQKKQTMITLRPVFPLVTQPTFSTDDSRNSSGHETGLGDIQLLTLLGPNKGEGLIWGAGATFIFPSASDDVLGQGHYQVGPSAMMFYMGKPWVGGFLAQHWNSVGGDESRPETTKTDIQYIIRKQIKGKGMSIGMGPNISIDWEASEGNRVNFPIGLGITKTVKWGDSPWKLRFEPQYAIIKQQAYGSLWNIRIQIAPIIKNPFL